MALAYRSEAHAKTPSSTTLTINVPAGVVDTDFLVAKIAARNAAGLGAPTITPPAGWSIIRSTPLVHSVGPNLHLVTYFRVASSEPANYSWTISTNAGAIGGISAWSTTGVTSVTIESSTGQADSDILQPTAPEVTVFHNDSVLIGVGVANSGHNWTPPTSMTEAWEDSTTVPFNTGGISMEEAYQVNPSVGLTGNKTFVVSGSLVTPEAVAAQLILLRDSTAAPALYDYIPASNNFPNQPIVSKTPVILLGSEHFYGDAADLDGSTGYFRTSSTLSGVADGKSGIFSGWFRIDGETSQTMRIFTSAPTLANIDNRFYVERAIFGGSTQTIVVGGKNSAGTSIFFIETNATFTTSSNWVHILSSWDLATGATHLYINDVADINTATDIVTNDFIDYTTPDWAVGAAASGGFKLNGCLSEIYFAPNQYLDFSIESNRRKFRTAQGLPKFLGTTGDLPTGVAPAVYLHLDDGELVTNFGTNRTGGTNFAANGTITNANTDPFDGTGILEAVPITSNVFQATVTTITSTNRLNSLFILGGI